MTIEVRQLIIRSRVGEPDVGAADSGCADGSSRTPLDEERVRQLLREGLEQCRRLIDKRLADEKER